MYDFIRFCDFFGDVYLYFLLCDVVCLKYCICD